VEEGKIHRFYFQKVQAKSKWLTCLCHISYKQVEKRFFGKSHFWVKGFCSAFDGRNLGYHVTIFWYNVPYFCLLFKSKLCSCSWIIKKKL